MDSKQYGLVHLSKQQKSTPKQTIITRPSIFDESDSDEETGKPSSGKSLPAPKPTVKKQTQLDLNRAIADDPTVFEYDSIYEQMKSERNPTANKSAKVKSNPKYITSLLEHAEERKKEQERRMERKIQKERENEGDEFKDKEAFVTTAYKLKLQEMEEAREKEEREKQIEELLDVTKQKDLSGFYRHLLNDNIDKPQPSFDDEQKRHAFEEIRKKDKKKFTEKKRHLRVRNSSESSEEHNSDSKIESNYEEKVESPRIESEESRESETETTEERQVDENTDINNDGKKINKDEEEEKIGDQLPSQSTSLGDNSEHKKKVDKMTILIEKFTKRTVGKVFEDARERYFERKRQKV